MPPKQSLPQSEDQSDQSHLTDLLDDELGFYPDGRKRTLTDEQIAMIRSSEVYSILRKRELALEQKEFEQKQELAGERSTNSKSQDKAVEAIGADKPASQESTPVRKWNKKQKFEPLAKDLPEREDDVPSRRVIRELDDIQAEEQILDY